MVKEVKSKAEFDEFLKSVGDKLVVVDFFATWCGPCKLIAPVLHKIEEELAAKMAVVKVDVDDNEELATAHQITSMPTFILYRNGEQLDKFSGANEAKLREQIKKYI